MKCLFKYPIKKACIGTKQSYKKEYDMIVALKLGHGILDINII